MFQKRKTMALFIDIAIVLLYYHIGIINYTTTNYYATMLTYDLSYQSK